MENLSLNDPPAVAAAPPSQPAAQQQQPPQPPAIPQLPPQMFTTAASLLDLTDKKLLITLRDGKKLLGVLRSWDQFGNLVLQDTVERVFAGSHFADLRRGLYLVRGENVLLMGEIDLDKEDTPPHSYTPAPPEKVQQLKKQEDDKLKRRHEKRLRRLRKIGFEGEHAGEAVL